MKFFGGSWGFFPGGEEKGRGPLFWKGSLFLGSSSFRRGSVLRINSLLRGDA